MKIYNYHPTAFEFLHESIADPDPLDKGKFLIPANATTKEPPKVKEGHVLVFENNEWIEKENHKGKIIYTNENKEGYQITELGALPENSSLIAPPE